jgi:3-hydroxy acid dehydrogenase/malonic semialdehyde reductase
MNRLAGKNILVTGASSGIGRACALEFAQLKNINLFVVARRLDRLTRLLDEIAASNYPQVNVTAIQLDVTDRSSVFAAFKDIEVDVLVNNAGLAVGVDHVADVPEDAFDTMFAVNVKGAMNVMQACLPSMKVLVNFYA